MQNLILQSLLRSHHAKPRNYSWIEMDWLHSQFLLETNRKLIFHLWHPLLHVWDQMDGVGTLVAL